MQRILFRVTIGLSLFAIAACASVATSSRGGDIARTVARISAEDDAASRIRTDIVWLADDAREGRQTGTDAYREAADYVAARFADIGLAPGANGEWLQEVPFVSGSPDLKAAALSITGPDGEVRVLKNVDEFLVYPSIAHENFQIENAEAVFIGFGVHAPEFGHDDFAGIDVSGKIVVYFSGAPDIFDNESRAHFNSSALKAKEASKRGAIGAVSLMTASSEERRPWSRVSANPSYSIMTWTWPDGRPETSGPNIKGTAAINPDEAPLLFAGAPKSYEEARAGAGGEGEATGSFDLAVKISMAGAVKRESVTSPNVVGLIPGSDPALKDEYVILTAHLDHIGINKKLIAEGKDGINNGAMDNAAGVAVMLDVARQFMAEGAPARSVLVVAVTAEEKGLLGSDYFAHFPTIGNGEMVANVNLDMPLMLHSFTDVIAFGAERSTIGPIMKAALDQTGIALTPDPIPEFGIFTRSDHYRFVEQGVPSIFLWTGFENGGEKSFREFYEEHYHAPSDDVSQWIRYDDLARFADVNYIIARALAENPEPPRWNEGDFFGDLFSKE